ncbi:hypothetical protein C8R45DRAFT_1019246 [Mycena sanguinolenta]|nr:hypothetical protein C8R45DRAFT_1019246 [Mycena sanguinolenta]
MKSSTTFFLGVSGAMAAAVSDPGPASLISSAISATTPILSSFSESIAVPPTTSIATSSIASPTGGFTVMGVYTTCLTLTFANPETTGVSSTSSDSFALSVTASSAPGVTSFTGTDTGVIPTATLSDASSAAASGEPIIPPLDEAIFTTCLAFLATPTITDPVTSTFASGSASISVPSVSATATASASAVTPE